MQCDIFFFVDESGHTGANLFDLDQPFLYYGVLSSKFNIEVSASSAFKVMRTHLGVERLHAAELGMGGLVELGPVLIQLENSLDLNFDFYIVSKVDHAMICFFDQVFDQGINPAVPWSSYWTPLRYILLLTVASLFDDELLKKAWKSRIEIRDKYAQDDLVQVCQILCSRLDSLPDERSRQIVQDALLWVISNPKEIGYNVKTKRDKYWVTPNLIGFQFVMMGIAKRILDRQAQSPLIVVDKQSQFNKTQSTLAEFYAEASGFKYSTGTGLPDIDYTGMPKSPIIFQSSYQSIGLELVDIYLWLFKRYYEGYEIPLELTPLIKTQLVRGKTDEISLNSLEKRWTKWFEKLPEPTHENLKRAKELKNMEEQARQSAVREKRNSDNK